VSNDVERESLETFFEKIIAGDTNFSNAATTTANTCLALTPAMMDQLKSTLKNIPPEPMGEFMRERGCPPEKWLLFSPASLKTEGLIAPEYVRFSELILNPICLKRMEI
jgi:hypothetical protein